MATKGPTIYRLVKCNRIPRLEGTLWEPFRVLWDSAGEAIAYHALEPRNKNEWGRFEVSCMDWEQGNAWLPDHMGTWEVVE